MTTEDVLMDRVKHYEEKAIDELCSAYYPKIYQYLFYRARNKQDAEDLTHEVFIKMVNNIQSQRGNFQKWIFTIARNTLTDYYRWKSKRSSDELLDVHASSVRVDDHVINQETLKTSLATLPKPQQDVITLKYVCDLTNEQIAGVIGKSEGAVKQLQFRAVSALKEMMA
jgi:RNA polymerase sigma-70 factor (ECF subfamily)